MYPHKMGVKSLNPYHFSILNRKLSLKEMHHMQSIFDVRLQVVSDYMPRQFNIISMLSGSNFSTGFKRTILATVQGATQTFKVGGIKFVIIFQNSLQ